MTEEQQEEEENTKNMLMAKVITLYRRFCAIGSHIKYIMFTYKTASVLRCRCLDRILMLVTIGTIAPGKVPAPP